MLKLCDPILVIGEDNSGRVFRLGLALGFDVGFTFFQLFSFADNTVINKYFTLKGFVFTYRNYILIKLYPKMLVGAE